MKGSSSCASPRNQYHPALTGFDVLHWYGAILLVIAVLSSRRRFCYSRIVTNPSMNRLPIEDVLPELRAALSQGSYALLTAPPGAGKTTGVPLALLDEPWLAGRKVVMLEPRRLAARAAAQRLAALLREPIGATVGYRMRMDSKVGPSTRVEVVTEGVLTRLLIGDPGLEGYGGIP